MTPLSIVDVGESIASVGMVGSSSWRLITCRFVFVLLSGRAPLISRRGGAGLKNLSKKL